jgi:predicted nucleotidyltransferase
MIDFARPSSGFLDDVGLVVDELVEKAALEPDRIMLVGARCRDVLHAALGHTTVNRSTHDLDVGLALSDWLAHERVAAAFRKAGTNGIRYRVAGVAVDVMPFGPEIEDPSGIARPAQRREPLIVFGFDDVFVRSLIVELPGAGHRIRIPTPQGYAALKLRAWVDRSQYGEFKDASDLATVINWYENWNLIDERLRGADSPVADLYFYDMPLACAHLLGRDIRHQLTVANASDLIDRFLHSDTARFASTMMGEPGNPDRRNDLVRALLEGLRRDTDAA